MRRLRIGQVPHRIAGPCRGRDIHQRRPSGRLRVTVRHPDRRAFLQGVDVTEVAREITEQRQLVRTGIPENGLDPVSTEHLIERITDVHRTVTPIQGQLGGWRRFRQGY